VKLLVISQSRNRAGRTIQVRKEIATDWVRVGRNAASEILLADPRIALSQGLIVDRNGPVYTEGEMGSTTSTTRKAVRSVRLSPGTSIEVGPYRLTAIDTPAGTMRPLAASTRASAACVTSVAFAPGRFASAIVTAGADPVESA